MDTHERLKKTRETISVNLARLKNAWTEERKIANRRRLKARRLWAKSPLLALQLMREEFPEYTQEQLESDLVVKSRGSKRKKKNPLTRYGRFREMERMRRLYQETGDPQYGLKYAQIRRNITKPYRMIVTINGQRKEYQFAATIDINLIKKIAAVAGQVDSFEAFDREVDELTRYTAG